MGYIEQNPVMAYTIAFREMSSIAFNGPEGGWRYAQDLAAVAQRYVNFLKPYFGTYRVTDEWKRTQLLELDRFVKKALDWEMRRRADAEGRSFVVAPAVAPGIPIAPGVSPVMPMAPGMGVPVVPATSLPPEVRREMSRKYAEAAIGPEAVARIDAQTEWMKNVLHTEHLAQPSEAVLVYPEGRRSEEAATYNPARGWGALKEHADRNGIWISQNFGTSASGRSVVDSISIHFTKPGRYVIENIGERRGRATSATRVVEVYGKGMEWMKEERKLEDARKYAQSRFVKIPSGVRLPDGREYEYCSHGGRVFARLPLQELHVYDETAHAWQRIDLNVNRNLAFLMRAPSGQQLPGNQPVEIKRPPESPDPRYA